ncbi:nitroreductase [Spirochaeta thermophila DSM 6578]|uniref:Nitroreductase n=1 Tax=Winmispira thermophila (strain ATCC 700085 / DSM 6578 / Z-1203) TaxID=869211 RepID=G0GC80_WINT7|nr:nitroreductase family protein [Spirochaeta thermophila]AEJ60444.1 nitroreductase [Spirochaeta thermophila DSM 6578]
MLDAIFARRSIRRYRPDPVPDGVLKEVLRAGMAAPSSWNGRPWAFVVIDDPAALEEIARRHGYAAMCREAPVAVLVCGIPEGMKEPDFLPQDLSAATENMLIAATELGLGSVWVGLFPHEDRMGVLREVCGLPPEVVPFSLVVLGYPAETKRPHEGWMDGRVFHGRWGRGWRPGE